MSKRHWNKREQEIRKEMLDKFEKMIDELIESKECADYLGLSSDRVLKKLKERLQKLGDKRY